MDDGRNIEERKEVRSKLLSCKTKNRKLGLQKDIIARSERSNKVFVRIADDGQVIWLKEPKKQLVKMT